jgi:hypothetical protein
MTAPIRQRIPLAASDEQVIVRRSAAAHDRAIAAAGLTGLPVPAAVQKHAPSPSSPLSIGAVLRGAARYERRRHVQPRHAHGLILGAYQRAVILAPSPASGMRRGTLYRKSR